MEQLVPLAQLRPHPLNPNKQTPETTAKIRAMIEATGFYPALIVRQIAGIDGYEILDGHHRWKILTDLGYPEARVENWGFIDEQLAQKYLATLNQLRGQDVQKKRATLLSIMRDHESADDLAVILPESSVQIDRVIEKWVKRATLGRPGARPTGFVPHNPPNGIVGDDGVVVLDDPDTRSADFEPLTFLVDAVAKRLINAALAARKGRGDVPGESIDPVLNVAIIADHYRGRLLRGVCEDWIIANAAPASGPAA